MYLITVMILVIAQRFYELKIARKNTNLLLSQGAIEFGSNHYWMLVLLHTLFFLSLISESMIFGVHPPYLWPLLLAFFFAAQLGRVWVMRTMNGRWTTRILVVPHETLVSHGPFRFVSHPNYMIVAIEILTLPLLFGLNFTALLFTVLNAIVLLGVRLPSERKALRWSQQQPINDRQHFSDLANPLYAHQSALHKHDHSI